MAKSNWGEGSVYQRKSDGKWIGSFDAGWTATGARRRITVTGRTEIEARRKLRDKRKAHESGDLGTSSRTTVKTWGDAWLKQKATELRPKGYNAAAACVNVWITPTIGKKRLSDLTPADVRAVTSAVRAKGNKASTANGVQRTLFNMLRDAMVEGHTVPPRVLLVKAPSIPESDRRPLTVEESLAALEVASHLPHGTRWVFALLHGMRQGECLGTTWDCIDLDAGVLTVAWQLQRFSYVDVKDKSKGFKVPLDLNYRHLYKSWHLTPPKSKAGFREIPLLPPVVDALLAWKEIAPENPWGLVWPNAAGRPADSREDLEEWHAIQATAGIGHPAGRYYHVHECRNVTATELRRANVNDNTLTALMGHASVAMTDRYARSDIAAKRAALTQVARQLGIGED